MSELKNTQVPEQIPVVSTVGDWSSSGDRSIPSSVPPLDMDSFEARSFDNLVTEAVTPQTVARLNKQRKKQIPVHPASPFGPVQGVSRQPSPIVGSTSAIRRVKPFANTPETTKRVRHSLFNDYTRSNPSPVPSLKSPPVPRPYGSTDPGNRHAAPEYTPISLSSIPRSLHIFANPAVLNALVTIGIDIPTLIIVTESLYITDLPSLYAQSSLPHTQFHQFIEARCAGGINAIKMLSCASRPMHHTSITCRRSLHLILPYSLSLNLTS